MLGIKWNTNAISLFFKLLLEIPKISYQWPEEVYTLYVLDKEVLISDVYTALFMSLFWNKAYLGRRLNHSTKVSNYCWFYTAFYKRHHLLSTMPGESIILLSVWRWQGKVSSDVDAREICSKYILSEQCILVWDVGTYVSSPLNVLYSLQFFYKINGEAPTKYLQHLSFMTNFFNWDIAPPN